MKGYRTILVFVASLAAYLLAWPELTHYLSGQKIAAATSAVALILRLVTTTPPGRSD